MNFFKDINSFQPIEFTSQWKAPSNIAFVKYWGKLENQIPANPSLSMTLRECHTITKTNFSPSDRLNVELFLDGKENKSFSRKVLTYLEILIPILPFLSKLNLKIETQNTFPHGTGIASSASGMAALALTLTDYLYHLASVSRSEQFFKDASYLARLGSGSACRSIYGGFATWGGHISNEYASPLAVHDNFLSLHDSILVINSEEKKVSSRSGHGLMKEHFFAEHRYAQANYNFDKCCVELKGDRFEEIGHILEAEALALHAMMMTSPSPYMLFHPNTIKAIQVIWQFRQDTQIPVFFTLDAGPNLHLIYPDSHKKNVMTFINSELTHLSEMVIFDRVGDGPSLC